MQKVLSRRSKLPTASFLLSLIFFVPLTEILAIILGIVALVRIHKSHHTLKGEALAVLGIIFGAIRLLFLIIITVLLVITAPHIKPSFLEARQNVKVAKVYIDFLRLEQLINEYYGQHQETPGNLLILKESGMVKTLPVDPFSENGQIYKYKSGRQVMEIDPKADFLIYSVGPDSHDDGGRKQYSTQDKNGDIIKVGQIKSLPKKGK